MANQDQQSQDTSMFRYKLTFGNTITEPGKDLTGLTLYQGTTLPFSDGSEYYNLTLMGVKVNKKIYQPCEIQAELFIMQQVIEGIGDTGTKVPSFKAVSPSRINTGICGCRATLIKAKIRLPWLKTAMCMHWTPS